MTNPTSKWLKDELDRRIIRELQRNARESTSNIAARLNVARSTVHERIVRLEKDGVISGYSVVLSRNPSVENVQVMVFLEVKQRETRKILHKISQYSEVRVCLSINGEFDLFISVEAPRIEDLDIIIDEIAMTPGVLRTKSFVVFGRRFDRRYNETAQRIAEQVLGDIE
ncbi:MAG: Lrp/AsnC family transcriptional regulator [Pseudomonadota bacterium]